MVQEGMAEALQFKSKHDRSWIIKGTKAMQKMQLEFIKAHQQERIEALETPGGAHSDA